MTKIVGDVILSMVPFVFSEPPVTAAVTQLVNEQHGVGTAIGIFHDGQLIYIKTFGLRNVADSKPVDADTRFEIGSVTKQFTAAAILQLQEQGKLSIDDRLAKYLPDFPRADQVTLRQLLNQVSGLPDYTDMPDIVAEMATVPDAAPKIAAYVAARPLDFTPGTKWEYSNTNYWLLGQVVAKVSGTTWEDYVREHLFAPAGMTHSGFIGDEPSFDDFATPYWQGLKNDGPLEPAPKLLESWPGGAGAIVSTIGDLAAWDTALAGGKIVSHDDFVLMSSAAKLANGKSTGYGMGLAVDVHDGHERIWHNGGTNGSVTENATYPNDRLDIIVLANSVRGDPSAVESAALEAMYPDALAAAQKPAPGEDLAMRPRILHLIDGFLNGTIQPSDMTPEMQQAMTPATIKKSAANFATYGPPIAEIFKQKLETGDGTWYLYRVEFAHNVENFAIKIDKKTGSVSAAQIRPAG
jgi:D-alanyl-D-alanine carboxypeptidase